MSILRSSKFVRYFVNFARSIVITQPRNVDKALLERSKSITIGCGARPFAFVAGSNTDINPIERSIQRLDQDVRRTGRISRKELLDVFDEIRLSRQATSTQSLMIIRCCGNLVPEESPEKRTKLVNEIWETFEKIGVPMDISHYNALLRVYLENEHHFSPTDFLTMLEKKGVEPNRVTFQRLIMAYCQRGDIEGATRILEFMKDKQMPVNESVFNALVVGHSQADDMESAKGILGVMQQANIDPSGETYTALLCGYARRGDFDKINELFQECNDKGVELLDKDILEVVFTLAVNNHSEHLDEVLAQLRKVFGYNQDAKNAILRLIVRGEDEAAMKVLKTMTPPSSGTNEISGSFVIKQMVRSNRSIERIVSLCNSLKESGQNEYALNHAVEASLTIGVNPDLSLKLLSELAVQEPVCQHYYWPVLVQFGKTDNQQGVFTTLQQITSEVGQAVSGETLKDYVIPYMKHSDKSIMDLRQGGISIGAAASATVGHLLSNNNIREATRIALQYKANYNSLSTRRSLVSAFVHTRDFNSLVSMVQLLLDGDREEEDFHPAEQVLLEIVNSLRGNDRVKIIQEILQRYLDKGIGLRNETADIIQNSLGGEELTQDISTLLSKLTSSDLVPQELSRPNPLKFVHKRSEETLLQSIKTIEAKGDSANSLKKDLLMHYCRNKDIQKAQTLFNKLNEEGFEFSYGHLAVVMEMYVNMDMLTEATDIYNMLNKTDTDKELDEIKLMKYALLLAKSDKTEDAINLFKKHNAKSEASDRDFTHTTVCWKLFNFFAEKGAVKVLKDLFKLMKDQGFIEPNNVLLGPLIKVHLVNDDMIGALDQFEECCNLYRATPWKNDLACRLIQKEDAASLQRLTDLSTQIHGEMNSLYDLVLSFVECGRIRQARKILETPGLRSRTQRINSACEKYTSEGRAKHLENLVEATKDISHIDRADIYYHLLLTYCKTDEVDKAVGLWTQMQDEDVQPTDQFLVALGSLLKKHNKPVPFAIPDVPETPEETEKNSIPMSRLTILRSLRRAVYAKELDEALELKNRMKDSDLLPSDRAKLLHLLVNNGRLREATQMLISWLEGKLTTYPSAVSHLVNTLAKLGDVDSVDSVGKYLDKETKKSISYINRRTHCMVEAGRAEEVLTELLESVKNAKTPEQFLGLVEEFPRGGIFAIINSHPEFLPKVEEIATTYREAGMLDPCNVLWMHYTIKGNEDKAQEYWSYLKPSERLMFIPLLNNARANGNDQMIVSLIKQCREKGITVQALGIIYSALLDILVAQHRENECANILEESLKICDIEHLSRRTLIRIKKAFESSGNEFKYTIPPMKNKREQTSADSSSSSSSDEELDAFKK